MERSSTVILLYTFNRTDQSRLHGVKSTQPKCRLGGSVPVNLHIYFLLATIQPRHPSYNRYLKNRPIFSSINFAIQLLPQTLFLQPIGVHLWYFKTIWSNRFHSLKYQNYNIGSHRLKNPSLWQELGFFVEKSLLVNVLQPYLVYSGILSVSYSHIEQGGTIFFLVYIFFFGTPFSKFKKTFQFFPYTTRT